MSQVPVKWCRTDLMTDHQLHYANGDPMGKQIPVVPLSALREVVEGLQLLATHKRSPEKRAIEQLCFSDDDWWETHGNQGFEQWLAQRLLAILGEVCHE